MYVLTRTVGSYSAGTRVKLLNYTKAHTAFIQVECREKEVLEVSQDDIVQRRDRTAAVNSPNSREKRKAKRQLTHEKENSPDDTGEQ